MTALLKFGVTWCNPLWWAMYIPYLLLIKLPIWVFMLPWNTVKGCVKAYHWTMKKFKSTWSRTIVLGLAIWTAIPGTWAWTFYSLAHAMGYGEEADTVVHVAKVVAGAAWEASKFAYMMATS